jgi:hypothetical protein
MKILFIICVIAPIIVYIIGIIVILINHFKIMNQINKDLINEGNRIRNLLTKIL